MTSTSLLTPSTAAEGTARSSGLRGLLRRLPAAVIGLIGAGVLGYGVTQPWVSTFAGLLTQSGWDTRNGNLLFAGAILAGVLAVVSAVVSSPLVRWLLALTGFATVAFGGYLLIQLYTATQTTQSMVFLGKGPGLFISTAGAAIVFATIFLPMPGTATPSTSTGTASDLGVMAGSTAVAPAEQSGSAWLRPIGSFWRYPAAALAVVAGLAHVPVTPEHLNEAPYIGISFMVLTTVCVVLAATMLLWDPAVVWLTLGGACLLAVIAYLLSRTVGLPLMADDVGNWLETLGVVSVVTETGVVLLAGLALRKAWRTAHA